jgi:hypothetical protein
MTHSDLLFRFMFSREIQLDTHGGPITLAPRWLRVPRAVKYSGLSRSKLYELLSDGRIRSICVRSQKGAQRGARLIMREQIDFFTVRHSAAHVGFLRLACAGSSAPKSAGTPPWLPRYPMPKPIVCKINLRFREAPRFLEIRLLHY